MMPPLQVTYSRGSQGAGDRTLTGEGRNLTGRDGVEVHFRNWFLNDV
jgi:hypothetical protein